MANLQLTPETVHALGFTEDCNCDTCGGEGYVINPAYQTWAGEIGDQLPEYVANDSRRFSRNPAAQISWDAENNAPTRWLPCPACTTPTVPDIAAKVFREGFCPLANTRMLVDLRAALAQDDERLIQGNTVIPLAIQPNLELQPQCVCPAAWLFWHSGRTVGQIEELFAWACGKCADALGDPDAPKYFLSWFDSAPREEARGGLLALIDLELAVRRHAEEESYAKELERRKVERS